MAADILAIALLCALTGPCDRATAIDVIPLGTARTTAECWMGGQMTLASLALVVRDGEQWQIRCEAPTSVGRDHVG